MAIVSDSSEISDNDMIRVVVFGLYMYDVDDEGARVDRRELACAGHGVGIR